eukprot:s556_g2.t1
MNQGAACLPLAPELVPDGVARALRSFPPDTAPGPSGLRVHHLREACAAGSTEAFLQQLCGVVGMMAQGQACASVAPSLAGASLVALPKPNGGVRPIAVGEILRRLTAKCLMEVVRDDARQQFAPVQLGVATPGGAEAAVHAARHWHDRNKGQSRKVLVKLDFKNAFSVPASCSGFRRLSVSSFGSLGDPLGPLLFACALHPLAIDLRQGPLDLAFFYFDDGVIAGDVASVGAALAHISAKSAELGLHLNLDKSEVISVGADTQHPSLAAHLPRELLVDEIGNSRVQTNFELLGAAVGDDAFTEAHAHNRAAAALPLLEAIGGLDDSQVGIRLLRSCAGHCRMIHNMRCAPPVAQLAGFQAFDQSVRACFSSLTGLHPTDGQWQQAARGFDKAGLGLRTTQRDGAAAYLASLGESRDLCARLDSNFSDAGLLASTHAGGALTMYNGYLPQEQQITLPAALGKRQKDLTMALDAATWEAQLLASSLTGRALLLPEAAPGARAKHKREDTWCPQCNGILDRFSLHAATCAAGGERTLRHHAIRDTLHRWAERAGLQPEREKPGLLLPQRPEDTSFGRRRPADVFVPSLAGIPTAFDIAITAPQRSESLREASCKAGAAADSYSEVKANHLNTAQVCECQGVRFQPMVVESTGAWSSLASHTLQIVARAAAAREGEEPAAYFSNLLQELSVTVRRFRARAVLRRRAELTSSGGVDAVRPAAALLLALGP